MIRRQRQAERKFDGRFAIHPTLYPSSGAIAVPPVAFSLFLGPPEDNEHNYGELFVLEITQ